MRKRGTAAASIEQTSAPQETPREYTGTDCSVCGRPQFNTPSGVTCSEGHGGAPAKPSGEDVDRVVTAATKPGFGSAPANDKPSIKKASEPLAQEMAKSDRDPEAWNVRSRLPGYVPLRKDVDAIVAKTFVDDVEQAYDALEAALKLGDRRTDYGSVMRALDEAETNARLAFKLWATVSVEADKWELENRELFAAMRLKANAKLQEEKDAKTRSKMITDQDVDDMAALLFPDEYTAQEIRRKRTKRMVDNAKDLLEKWQSRCFSLRTQADKLR